MKILYIAFSDFSQNPSSGSQVRPLRMLRALMEEADELRYVDGLVNDYKKRKTGCDKARAWLTDGWKPDLCYIESPSGPVFFSCDRKLIYKIWKLKIPIAVFYRDAYWRFPNVTDNQHKNIVKYIKSKVIQKMQKHDWKMWKLCCKIIYFPSAEMAKYFTDVPTYVMPPGCEKIISIHNNDNILPVGIFVGGATERYGMPLLLDSIRRINADKEVININIVCSEEGWNTLINKKPEYITVPGVRVYHLDTGESLQELYEKSDFAIVPLKRNVYNDFAFPVKLVEYVSHGLPIVTTDCTTSKDFVDRYSIGISAEDNVEAFSSALIQMAKNVVDGNKYENELLYACQDNLWTKRVKQIISDLEIMFL